MREYNRAKDQYGEEINEHRPNVTNTRPPVGTDKLSNKKILFVGDSHMRGMADLFLYHVCKFKIEHLAWNRTYIELERTDEQPRATYLEISMLQKSFDAYKQNCVFPTDDPKCQLFDLGCTGMTFAYLGAMYCQQSIANYANRFDYVIMNCGHHPAATSHFGYQKYDNEVNKLFNRAKVLGLGAKVKMFWLENTAQPLRQDKYTEFYKDWRTYHRLILFDAIAKFSIQRSGLPISILPAWSSTLALFDKMCDCGHYAITAKYPQLLGLLDAIFETSWSPLKNHHQHA